MTTRTGAAGAIPNRSPADRSGRHVAGQLINKVAAYDHYRHYTHRPTTLPNLQKHGPLNPIWHSTTNAKPLRLAALINGRREHGG